MPVIIRRDFSWLEPPVFWRRRTMEFNRWAHPYDQHGTRTDYDAMPVSLADMVDDPYRTLAARVRMVGGLPRTPYRTRNFLGRTS